MKFYPIIIIIALLYVTQPSFAVIEVEKSFVRFQGKTVSVDDPVGHLVQAFGEPYHKEKKTNWTRVGRNRVVERDVFLWFYRIEKYSGQGSSNYRIMIYDGLIQKIVDMIDLICFWVSYVHVRRKMSSRLKFRSSQMDQD